MINEFLDSLNKGDFTVTPKKTVRLPIEEGKVSPKGYEISKFAKTSSSLAEKLKAANERKKEEMRSVMNPLASIVNEKLSASPVPYAPASDSVGRLKEMGYVFKKDFTDGMDDGSAQAKYSSENPGLSSLSGLSDFVSDLIGVTKRQKPITSVSKGYGEVFDTFSSLFGNGDENFKKGLSAAAADVAMKSEGMKGILGSTTGMRSFFSAVDGEDKTETNSSFKDGVKSFFTTILKKPEFLERAEDKAAETMRYVGESNPFVSSAISGLEKAEEFESEAQKSGRIYSTKDVLNAYVAGFAGVGEPTPGQSPTSYALAGTTNSALKTFMGATPSFAAGQAAFSTAVDLTDKTL